MKIFGLKQPIPKHIYDQAKAADLGRPDFYVGPTVTPKARPGDTRTDGDKDRGLETRMTEAKEAVEKRAAEEDRGPTISLLARLFHRRPFRRARSAP